MAASISIFSRYIRTPLALWLISCYRALELVILLEAWFVQCEGQHQQEELWVGTAPEACKDIIIKPVFLLPLTFDPLYGSRRVNQKLSGLVQPWGLLNLLFICWFSSDMDINAARALMDLFPLFSVRSLDCRTPFTYAAFIAPPAYCNYFLVSERDNSTGMSTEQKSQSPHVDLPCLFHSLTVCSSFHSLSGTLSQWFFICSS